MPTPTDRLWPIVYVRGYAMTESEIAATVATPYMGFNDGSTKVRQSWDKRVVRHVFESPLVRLMKEYGYRDVYSDGAETEGTLPRTSLVVYRYYEPADRDLGTGKVPSIVDAARGLDALILRLREQVAGDDPAQRAAFRVHLVAHSMGGLVVRCFLQNLEVGSAEARAMVDRVFTYATPHNGIEIAGFNVPSFLGIFDIKNFNRETMAGYLGLPRNSKRVDSLDGKFPPERFFCLVGTNHRDYDTAFGIARRLAGEMSDGLVAIENAAVQGAPRAFVHRSHSGPYGIVNSEEGYQNLVRFLFGDVRVDGVMEIDALPLPPSIEKERKAGHQIRASYYFESTVAPRGAFTFTLTERRQETASAVLRQYDELVHPERLGLDGPRWPMLFSVFLDSERITRGQDLVFSVELAVSSTGYVVDRKLRLDRHLPGEKLYRDTLAVRVRCTDGEWQVRSASIDEGWSERPGRLAKREADGSHTIVLESKKGFRGRLRLTPQRIGTAD
jgi:hypothetical protein